MVSSPSDDVGENPINGDLQADAQPLMQDTEQLADTVMEVSGEPPGKQDPLFARFYISHTLSTFNSRVFEFGAILYLASIFPGNLLPMSIYAICRSASAVVLGPTVGRWIDRSGRLTVVRTSISKMNPSYIEHSH